MLVAKLAQCLQEFRRGGIETAFALHRLDDDRGTVGRCQVDLEQVVDGFQRILDRYAMVLDRERRVINLGRERTEQVLVRGDLSGQAHRQHGPAVETAVECDHAPATGMRACDLDRVLDRLGAGGDEDRLLLRRSRGELVEFFGEAHGHVVRGHHDAGMAEVLYLLGDRGGDLRVAVTGRGDRDTGTEIDVTIALDVPQFGALGARDVDRRDIALAARNRFVLARLPVGIGEPLRLRDFQFCLAHWSIPPRHMYLISR